MHRYFILLYFCLLSLPAVAGTTCAASNVMAMDTRNFGVCAESNVLSVDTRTSFDLWVNGYGFTGLPGSTTADPLHDGVSHLLKYAFNLDPTVNGQQTLTATGVQGLPAPELAPDGSLTLRVIRRRNDPALTYTAQFSSNLDTWTPVLSPGVITPIDATWERVIFQAPAALHSGLRTYVRMFVSYLPP